MKEMSKSRYHLTLFWLKRLTLSQSYYQKKCEFCNEREAALEYLEAFVNCLFGSGNLNNNHRFIVNMIYAFQDRDNLYLVMDLLTGGDLRFHISRQRRFSEEQTSIIFYWEGEIGKFRNRVLYCLHIDWP